MNREQKQELVSELHQLFGEVSTVVVAHYSGLTVAEMENLRKQMRAAGASFRVTKNRLTRLALDGTKFDSVGDLLTGPTGIAVSADPVAAAKAMVDFAKTNPKLVILGGNMNGSALNSDGVKALATMPSLDELRARLVGMIQTPGTRIATVLSQPAAGLARVLNAYATKGEAA
ncbi:50S ribosomal protein L10 [Novispirillum itersonii]|uniref:Large ribosomal subunit protein uL10 n=1 Tax=Novispirillum itersonii TaxID=189 RepID=A0A7W9ZFA1_NOVIT|nr:50S ribosomal protein L10 [Novispirillum itersonii]MBB6208959.1 large subunit ribosomal protein L10 [Novispirillum itersonii]